MELSRYVVSFFFLVGQCQRIKIPLCQNMTYNLTQFPNLLNHRTQYKAIAAMEEFREIVYQIKRCPLFRPFLCSVLVPPCDGYQKPTPPCQELCYKAVRNCRHLLAMHKITLPSAMRCGRLPKEGTSRCLNQSSLQRASPCQDLQDHACKKHLPPPQRVQFPNYFGHMSGKEASVGFDYFDPIFNIAPAGDDCSFLLSHFLCRLHTPPCRKTLLPLPPCRELCLQAKSQCKRITEHLGFQWPAYYNCTQFPRKNKAPCYSGPLTGGENRMSKTGNKCLLLNLGSKPGFFSKLIQELCKFSICAFFGVMNFALLPDVINFVLQKIDKIQINQSYLMQKAYPV